MKASIDVKDRKEAAQLRVGLAIPEIRAFVITMGVLHQLPSDRARARVLTFVRDYMEEQRDRPLPFAADGPEASS